MIIVMIDAIISLKDNDQLIFWIKNSIDLATAHDFCAEIMDKDKRTYNIHHTSSSNGEWEGSI